MTRDNKIDYVEFFARDIVATKEFYGAVFGWKFTDYGPDYSSFEDGRIAGGFRTGTISPPGTLIVIYVQELAATVQRVKAAGGTIVKDIFTFPGGSRFEFADPSGNVLAAWRED